MGKRFFEQYEHHDKTVWVRSALKGKHRNYCLCYSCVKFRPSTPVNCFIAQEIYEADVAHGITTPVWECPKFVEKKEVLDGN